MTHRQSVKKKLVKTRKSHIADESHQTKARKSQKQNSRKKKKLPEKKRLDTSQRKQRIAPSKKSGKQQLPPISKKKKGEGASKQKNSNKRDISSRKKRRKKAKRLKEWRIAARDFLLILGGVLIVSLIVCSFFVQVTSVNGYGMAPTLRDSDTIFVRKTEEANRLDLIVFQRGNRQEVQRVIGLPGDRVEYVEDTLYVNGKIVNEPFIVEHINEAQRNGGHYTEDFKMQGITGKPVVPEDCYFVLGDNREWAIDSREYGFVEKEQVNGVVKMRLLPINGLQSFS